MEIICNEKKQTRKSWTNPWKYALRCEKLQNFANQTHIKTKSKHRQYIHIFFEEICVSK